MFHRVIPEQKRPRIRNKGIEVSPELLEEVIAFFKKREYDFISIDTLPDYLRERSRRKFVIFTFDDGYIDNYTLAYPIFRKHHIPFTVYVTTNFPEYKAVMWWYLLEDLLLTQDTINCPISSPKTLTAKGIEEKEQLFARLRAEIISAGAADRDLYFQQLFVDNDISLYDRVRVDAMSWDHLLEMSEDPLVTLGAHTMSHPALSKLTEDQLAEEVMGSKAMLEEKLSLQVAHFAYPFGSKREAGLRDFDAVAAMGFKTATTTREGNIFKEHLSHLTSLPRIYISPDTTERHLSDFVSGKIPLQRGIKNRIITA